MFPGNLSPGGLPESPVVFLQAHSNPAILLTPVTGSNPGAFGVCISPKKGNSTTGVDSGGVMITGQEQST
jgi:hypothetical protein